MTDTPIPSTTQDAIVLQTDVAPSQAALESDAQAQPVQKQDTHPSQPPVLGDPREKPFVTVIIAVIVVVVLGVVLIGPDRLQSSGDGLQVIASVRGRDDTSASLGPVVAEERAPRDDLSVLGRVVQDGKPAAKAVVWVVAEDESGNQVSPPGVTTQTDGEFSFGPFVSPSPKPGGAVKVTVYTTLKGESWYSGDRQGKSVIVMDPSARRKLIRPLVGTMGLMLTVFAASLVAAFLTRERKGKYYLLIGLSVLFPVVMIVIIAYFQTKLSGSVRGEEILSLGFANVYEGRFGAGQPAELLLSLTARPDATSALATGFGAPLWVVLLSVVGSALLTVSLVVSEIKEPIDFCQEDKKDLDKDLSTFIQRMVQHQFFVLFAPLGGIFVYQALLVAKAGTEPMAVAVAALGAGATLNALLAFAVKRSERLFREDSNGTTGGGKKTP